MYLDFYGLREKPFNLTPDPRFVFLSKNHREAFAHLLYGIGNHAGFIALTGEVGSGKTTVLRALLTQMDTDHHRTALIFNPCLSAPQLLQNISREFGIPAPTAEGASPLEALNQFLLQQNAEGRTTVLVIDETQNLEPAVLEQIRLISNLETDREKLIQIVLSGQPEFGQMLKKKDMQQLSQRITVRYHLQSMDFQDTVDYISHRLGVSGRRGGAVFSRGALKEIYRYSRGLPRLINAACDRALLAGYTKDKTRITSQIAAAGIKDLERNTAPFHREKRLILIPAFFILAVLLAAAAYLTGREISDQLQGSPPVETAPVPVKTEPARSAEDLSRSLSEELGKVPEAESARRAFNGLAVLWKAQPVPENVNLSPVNGLERAALDRKLRLYRFSGNLGALLRIGHPAVLEVVLPGIPGKRFIVLTGLEKEQLLIEPPVAGRRSFSFGELERYWSGQGFLLWKDPLALLTKMWPGSRGAHVKKLQGLLQEAGTYAQPLTGVYDAATRTAVKAFQAAKGIEQDGIAGSQTLMFLYRSIDRYEMPRIAGGAK